MTKHCTILANKRSEQSSSENSSSSAVLSSDFTESRNIVEPLNKGHIGSGTYLEVVPISEVPIKLSSISLIGHSDSYLSLL